MAGRKVWVAVLVAGGALAMSSGAAFGGLPPIDPDVSTPDGGELEVCDDGTPDDGLCNEATGIRYSPALCEGKTNNVHISTSAATYGKVKVHGLTKCLLPLQVDTIGVSVQIYKQNSLGWDPWSPYQSDFNSLSKVDIDSYKNCSSSSKRFNGYGSHVSYEATGIYRLNTSSGGGPHYLC